MYKVSIKQLLALMMTFIMCALLVPLVFIVMLGNEEIDKLKREEIGTSIIPDIQQINVLLAQHRGTANRFLNGNFHAFDKLKILEPEIDSAFHQTIQKCGSYSNSNQLPCTQLETANQKWLFLKEHYASLDIKNSFSKHTLLIADLLIFQSDIADVTHLSLDSSVDTYYLMNNMVETLPLLVENIGQLRGFGSGLMVKHKTSAVEQIEVAKLVHGVRLSMESVKFAFDKIFTVLPEFEMQQHKILLDSQQHVETFLQAVENQVISEKNNQITDEQFYNQATEVIEQVMQLYQPVVNSLNNELNQRIHDLILKRYTILTVFLFLLTLVIVFLNYIQKRFQCLNKAVLCFQALQQGHYDYPITIKYYDEVGQLLISLGKIRDQLAKNVEQLTKTISEQKQANEKIAYLAHYDALTNLMNRVLLQKKVETELNTLKQTELALALLFIDLDGFKNVNDNLGHDIGDQVLKNTAIKLKQNVREQDFVARLGGDEFVVVLLNLNKTAQIEVIVKKLVNALHQELIYQDSVLYVTPSIGIAISSVENYNDYEQLLTKADKAMYAAKNKGKNTYQFSN